MSVQIIENNVQLSIRTVRHQFVHEIQKLPSSAPGIVAGFHLSGSYIQCRKQRRRPMSLIAMAETIHSLAIGQSKIALRALQGLDVRLFIYAQNQRVLRWAQIQAHHVGGLRSELGFGSDAPPATSLQLNPAL